MENKQNELKNNLENGFSDMNIKQELTEELHNDPVYDAERSQLGFFENSEQRDKEACKNSEISLNKEIIEKDPDNKFSEISKTEEKQTPQIKINKKDMKISKDTPFDEILSNFYFLKLFKKQPKQLINYLCLHIDDIIYHCFSSDNTDFSHKCYVVLGSMDEKIVASFLSADRFQMLGAEITLPEDPDLFKLGRFVSLISAILDYYPNLLINCCGFLCRLLHHMYIPFVAKLLNKFCKGDKSLSKLQMYLIELGFDDIVYRELVKFKHTPNANYYASKDIFRTAALLRMITSCIGSDVLGPKFSTVHFLSFCENNFLEDLEIENQKWVLIFGFLSPDFSPNLLNFVFTAVELLNSADKSFHLCHYYALKFLANMLKYTEETEELLMATNIVECLIKLMFKFYGSSFFQKSFRMFIITAIKKEKIVCDVVQSFAPSFMGILLGEEYIEFKSTVAMIINTMQAYRTDFPALNAELLKIDDFDDFFNNVAKPRIKILDNFYGEEYPGQIQSIINSQSIN